MGSPLPVELETRPPERRLSFASLFIVYAGVAIASFYAAPSGLLFGWLLEALAVVVGAIASIFGVSTVVQGPLVSVPGEFGIEIALECSGVPELLLFLSAVLAFPTSAKSKAVGLVVALIGITIGNVVRLAALLFVGLYANEHFDFVHTWVQGLMSYLLMIVLWLGWLKLSAMAARSPMR